MVKVTVRRHSLRHALLMALLRRDPAVRKPPTDPEGEFARSVNRLAEQGHRGPWPHGAVPLEIGMLCECGERATFTAWPPSEARAMAERAGWRNGRCPAHVEAAS